jgi:signal transduction histidine kinase
VTREEALTSLKSGSPHERLRAARCLLSNSEASDLDLLKTTRSSEADFYVRATLDMAISRLSDSSQNSGTASPSEPDFPEGLLRRVKARAVEWVTALLLHEVASPFGLVANAASRELQNYEASSTKRHIERVQRIFDGIEQLRKATATPRPEHFDLDELISQIIGEDCSGKGVEATPYGPKPFMVRTDPNLLRFAISNGLRNAIDASLEPSATKSYPVVVTWGETEVDYYLAIIDQGPGLVGPVEAAFEAGKSTKPGHSGFGLAIARQAMETLDGLVSLSSSKGGGARYELRWGR